MFWKTSLSLQTNKRSSHSEVLCQKKTCLQSFAKFAEKYLYRCLLCNEVAGWKSETVRSSYWRCSVKQGVFKNFSNFTGKHFCWSLLLIKLQVLEPATLLRKTLTRMLSCRICKLFLKPTFLKNVSECLLLNFI